MKIKSLLFSSIKTILLLLILLLAYPVGYFVLDTKQNINSSYFSSPHSGVGAYIINLDRSRDRYKLVKPKVEKLGFNFKRISAVDGSKLSSKDIDSKVDLNTYQMIFNHLPKKGTIGCSLSHIQVWQDFLESNYEYALIFEDDVTFDPIKLRETIDELLENNNYWDITLFSIRHKGHPLTIKTLNNGQKLSVYLTEITTSPAYIINRKTAIKLLEKAFPIRMPIDHYFTRMWEFDILFTGIENPRLAHQQGDSVIAVSSNVAQDHKLFINYIKRSVYKLQSYVIRFLYNVKCYLKIKLLPIARNI